MADLAWPRIRQFDGWARIVLLGLGLVLCCVFGLVTPYLIAVVGIILTVQQGFQRRLLSAYSETTARLFLVGFVVLAACYAASAKSWTDVLLVFNFSMLLLYAPIRAEFAAGAAPGNARLVANLAALGTLAALAVALFQLFVIGVPRADNILFGAILLANTAIVLGFLSLIGTMTEGPFRWGFLAMPLVAVFVATLTGSRGPLLAIAPLVIIATIFIARKYTIKLVWAILLGAAYLALCAAIVVAVPSRSLTLLSAISEATGAGAGGVGIISDTTTQIRLDLYWAGYQAFLQSPIFGHGWARLMSAAYPFLPVDKAPYMDLPQLHNDVVNFGVAAGVIGIGVYLLLIVAPIAGILNSPRDSQFTLRLYGGLILVTAYVFDGLTDLMLGFEFHTAIFAVISAILIGFCRDRPTGQTT